MEKENLTATDKKVSTITNTTKERGIMKKEKVASIINKTAKALEDGDLNNKQAKAIMAKLSDKLEKAGKTHTAKALKNIIAEEVVEDTESAELAEGIAKAIMAIYKKRQDFIKVKNKRVRDIYTGLTGADLLQMKMLPFLEMIANTPV